MKKIFGILLALGMSVAAFAQTHKIELNLTKGKVYTLNSHVKSEINQTINGQANKIQMAIGGKMSFKVLENTNAVYNIAVWYDRLSMRMKLPNGVFEFSSNKKSDKDFISAMLAAVTDKSFFIKMSTKGKVLEVVGIDSLFSNMVDQFPQIGEEQKKQIQKQIMQSYGADAFKGQLEMTFAILPSGPVSLGDTWKIKTKLESGMAANVESHYTLKEVTDSFYIISGNSKIATVDNNDYIEINGMPVRYDLNGTQQSIIQVSRITGWVIEGRSDQMMQGVSHIKDCPKMPGGMSIPMVMKNETTITD
jgi:hypothetical protein